MMPSSIRMAPLFRGAPQYQNGPLCFPRSHSVTMDHEIPQCHSHLLGSVVSQWPLGSMWPHGVTMAPVGMRGKMAPGFHKDPQCHNGVPGSMRFSCVTMASGFQEIPSGHS